MEIYFPPGHDPKTASVPGVILFHGGSWIGGSLDQFRSLCAYLASRGLVSATAQYRFHKGEKLPVAAMIKRICITDAKSAIRWFKQNAKELGVDPNRIISGGGSAGGHIATLATLNPGLDDPSDPQEIDTSVIAYLWFNPAHSPGDSKDPEVDALQHIKPQMPPSIVFFGDKDDYKKGWDTVHEKICSLGPDTAELFIAPGQGHSFFNAVPWMTACAIAVDEFLTKLGLLKGKPTLNLPASGQRLVPANP
jgi:dienelactone hydrolase